ncbi:cytochrome b/b6 domain-containing protein [Natronobacterium gregoryi]|uniref:Prokaryotic cytochrome b561 n=2 Tax=Natronobacterium gregoryi TaxID=44930 RepID=L0AIR8_NATGS|nr:cytochrome b/b6 domain-containing protein [Natronobacterium gregoryi]AFZ73339.1 Prokaryotic cytochrome b561 [Natronobacterium gregoryi SP2]PLK18793.1 hypothetical protein CYV19_17005 [Natronobacterium gregoryi SP2]SFJ64034.1 formate dehydrogenase subunit gamma [Natronobacterium gregoryi]
MTDRSINDADRPPTDEGSSDRVQTDGGTREVDHGGIIDIEQIPVAGKFVASIRTEIATRYAGYLTLNKEDKETIHRWGTGSIICHWVMVLCMFIALVTGVQFWTGWYGPLNIGIWDGYQVAFQLHMWAGVILAVIALVIFPYYHKFVDGHELLVSLDQIKEEIIIAVSFVGLTDYIPGYKKARRTYNEDHEEWVGYHPMQTVFWYVTWFFVLALTVTGFALWNGIATDPAWWIAAIGFMEGWVTYETMLRLHLLATFWVIAAVSIHAYFPLMPSNLDMTKSMFTGTLEGWVVDDETKPEPDAESTVERTQDETSDD